MYIVVVHNRFPLWCVPSSNICFLSFFKLRTTKTGNLPNLSYIKRKPEPLGTEFKNIVDGLTGSMLWMEIQEGKLRMANKEHQDLGSTCACVLRGVAETSKYKSFPIEDDTQDTAEQDRKRLYFGDSWFGSVKAVANVGKSGNHCCMIIKTGHSRSPKKFLEEKMKDMPGGTWITMEGTPDKEGVPLVSIGYKYNKKNVLTFILTRGAGKTTDGEPYEARFPDKYGNVCIRLVRRPEILLNYFKYSNCVDMHNQARQFDLGLEKKWVTHNGYFRLYTTILGMTVTDTWKQLKKRDPKYSSITEFADVLAREMIQYSKSLIEEEEECESVECPVRVRVVAGTDSQDLSSVTQDKSIRNHTRIFLKGRKQVRCIWCSRVNLVERKTTMKCSECDKGFCRDNTGYSCWSHHVCFGGVPQAPKKGTRKRLVREAHDEEDHDGR